MEKENWKNIINYEGYYQVSNLGNVKSLERKCWNGICHYTLKERILKPAINGNGYLSVILAKDGNRETARVHVLVAIAFLNHKPNKKQNVVVDHIKNIKTDNRVINLQLISQRENASKNTKGCSSKYVGVSFYKLTNKWRACIRIGKLKKHLGYFNSELEAHITYQNELNKI